MFNATLGSVLIMRELTTTTGGKKNKSRVQSWSLNLKITSHINAFKNYTNTFFFQRENNFQIYCARAERMQTAIRGADNLDAIKTILHNEQVSLQQLGLESVIESKYYKMVMTEHSLNEQAIAIEQRQKDTEQGRQLRKAIESNAPNKLEPLRSEICDILDDYISSINLGCTFLPYKFSIFGHHHETDALTTQQEIQNAPTFEEIKDILSRELKSLEPTEFKVAEGSSPPTQGEYHRQILTACEAYERVTAQPIVEGSQNDEENLLAL